MHSQKYSLVSQPVEVLKEKSINSVKVPQTNWIIWIICLCDWIRSVNLVKMVDFLAQKNSVWKNRFKCSRISWEVVKTDNLTHLHLHAMHSHIHAIHLYLHDIHLYLHASSCYSTNESSVTCCRHEKIKLQNWIEIELPTGEQWIWESRPGLQVFFPFLKHTICKGTGFLRRMFSKENTEEDRSFCSLRWSSWAPCLLRSKDYWEEKQDGSSALFSINSLIFIYISLLSKQFFILPKLSTL